MHILVERYLSEIRSYPHGLTGVNQPGKLEANSGIYLTKSGARAFSSGFIYDPQTRSAHYEWGAVLSGSINFRTPDNNQLAISSGGSYLIKPLEKIIMTSSDNPIIVWLEITGSSMEEVYAQKNISSSVTAMPLDENMLNMAMKIVYLLQNHPAGYQLQSHAYLWRFFSFFLNPPCNPEKVSSETLQVIEYIENLSPSEHCDLSTLAKVSKLPAETFRKRFCREVGQAPMHYLISRKIRIAKEMLGDTTKTISEISREVGIDDLYYFSRLFKKIEGLSPQNYRKHFYQNISETF